MADFTLYLWEVMEFTDDIGLKEYPIFKEEYRATLNKKIVDRYLNREIGHETIDQFIHNMRRKMNEIMPYYNQMYLSEQIKYDPLTTINMESLGTGVNQTEANSTGNSTNTGDSEAESLSVTSTYPQSALDDSDEGVYGDGSSESKSKGKQSAQADETRNEKAKADTSTTSNTKGYQGSPASLIMEYRRAILNIDVAILGDLNELFMSVLTGPTEFFSSRGYY